MSDSLSVNIPRPNTGRVIIVTGAANGLGAAIIEAMLANPDFANDKLVAFDKEYGDNILSPFHSHAKFEHVKRADILINCAGINLTGWIESMKENEWIDMMDTNAFGLVTMVKAALPGLIEKKGTVLNIVSNASHMPMTCSNGYNASKAAAHMITLQMAHELTKKYGITVFGISPNKLAGTKMSKAIEEQVVRDRGWTPEFAAEYQRNSLLAGEETDPRTLADFIAYLLGSKDRHKFLTGCVIPYGK